jgi:small-conductance mechanosensitive channel/CRP-like cAMP-binding protein
VTNLQRLFWPLLTCLILLYPAYFMEDLLREIASGAGSQLYVVIRNGIGVGIWLAGAWLVSELLHVLLWDRFTRPVPSLLKHIFSILIFGLAITGISGFVFGQSLTGIWATSSVLGIVMGFAGRSLIADLFCGIAMHLDPPFRIGDWIEWREGDEEILAKVEQINWRSTRVHARDDTKTLFIPNSHLSSVAITNVFAPLGRTRQVIRIPLDPSVDLNRAERVLLAGALMAEGPLASPAPDVLLEGVTSDGLIFLVRYWHEPETSIAKVRSSVLFSILEALEHAGIKTARQRHEVLTAPLNIQTSLPKDARWILRQVEIFHAFSDEEINSIADQSMRHEFPPEASVVRQGQPGDSLYFVQEGLLDVLIEQPGQPPLRVSRLSQGQYFGEMSLLTGDPRSATVVAATGTIVYEVAKSVLEPILSARPDLTHQLAQTIARRKFENQSTLTSQFSTQVIDSHETFTSLLLTKIKGFFATS